MKKELLFKLWSMVFWGCLLVSVCGCKDKQAPAPTTTPAVKETTTTESERVIHEVNTDDLDPNRDPMGGYPRMLDDGKVSFRISESRISGTKYLRVLPRGLADVSEELVLEVDGNVTNAQLADLNGDNHSDLVFFTQSKSDEKNGSVLGLISHEGLSVSELYLPSIIEDSTLSAGYIGYDKFIIKDNKVMRRFPLFENGVDTRRHRTITYGLHTGEASFLLKPVSHVDAEA